MTGTPVAPLIPPAAGHDRAYRTRTGWHQRLPVPQLATARVRATVYGLSTIDHRGRVADLGAVRALGWKPRNRLDIRDQCGLLVVTATPQGVFRLTDHGHLRLPAAVRRCCGLGTGDRVLLAAQPADGLLVVHPPAALDAMVDWLHASALGGDQS